MARNQFSSYGRSGQALPLANGKSFYCLPASSALIADVEQMFPVDEDGVPRVFSGNDSVATALTYCVANRGDVIYCLEGTYTISTALAMSVAGVHLVGLGTPGAAKLTASAADVMDLTGDNCEVKNLQITIATTKKGIDMVGADNCVVSGNIFLSSVGGAASHFIHMNTTACNYNLIQDNRFISNLVVAGGAITQTSHITGLGIGNIIEHNLFMAGRVTTANAGAVTTGVLFAAAADAGNLVRGNSFTEFNGATFTAGVDYGTTALGGSVMCYFNNFMMATAANAVVPGSNAGSFANNIADGTV